MYFSPFDVTTPHVIYALFGAFTVLFGMFSLLLREKLYIGEAIWAFIFGIIIGPYGANIFNPRTLGHASNPEEPSNLILIEFTRVVLAIGVFAIGVELPKAYMVKHWKSLFFLLVPTMTWGWFVCAGLIYTLIPGLNFLSSLAISACLTPTDPILASAVVGGRWADKHVPTHIRHLLAAESACNDGAAFPFLFFALYLMTELPSLGNAMRNWFLVVWLYEVILGIAIGAFLGFSFRHLMKFCQRHDFIDRQSYVGQYLSLAILTIGLTTLLGIDDLLAAFACGTAFAWDGFFNRQTEESVFSSVIDILFNVAAFIFVGAWMPFGTFHKEVIGGLAMGFEVWRLVILAVLVLLLRRLPIIMGLFRWIPDIKTWREGVFIGHFGPMGIGAIFISTLASEFLHDYVEHNPTSGSAGQRHQIEMVRDMIQPIVAFMVLCSITIHGLSIPGFSLGRRVHSVTRTWSRRDTTGSGRTGAPDWTNQARLVTRGEDIVINRDLERGEGRGVPLEKTMTMMSMRTLNSSSHADSQKENVEKEDTDTEPSVQAPTPTPQANQDRGNQDRPVPPNGERHQTSEWKEGDEIVVESRLGGPGDDVEVTVIDDRTDTDGTAGATSSWTGRKLHELERGAEEIGQSMRDHGVWKNLGFGRRRSGGGGSGSGASTPVAASGSGGELVEMANRTRTGRPTTADTLVADEDIDGPGVSEDSHYSQEAGGVVASTSTPVLVPEPTIGNTGDTTAVAAAAAPVPSDPSAKAPRERKNKRRSVSLTRLPSSRTSQNQQAPPLVGHRRPLKTTPADTVNLNLDSDYPVQYYDDYDSDTARASNADNEITEVSRGRAGRLGMNPNTTTPSLRTTSGSYPTLNPRLGMGRTSATPTGISSSTPISPSILLPILTSSTIPPLQYSPHLPPTSRSRPRTAPTSPTSSSTTISLSTGYATPLASSTPISRPGTADSNNSIRHHRLNSIRAGGTAHPRQGHRTPTRESSPSRSVRFIDYADGESGYVGPQGPVRDGGSGSGGRTILVVEIPPPTPSIPKSYSFSKDKDGGGRTLVDSPVEEERSLNAVS
ncbi:hypothetical protein BYT27DRAFT_7183207 [Phlegmacium glaucopus]|nr:hypothetical protein BYT27DRAFT_7183207 [Phlegmacium glaucopus]